MTDNFVIVVEMHGGTISGVHVSHKGLEGAEVIVTERPDEASMCDREIYVKGGKLDGELIYHTDEAIHMKAKDLKPIRSAAKKYRKAGRK